MSSSRSRKKKEETTKTASKKKVDLKKKKPVKAKSKSASSSPSKKARRPDSLSLHLSPRKKPKTTSASGRSPKKSPRKWKPRTPQPTRSVRRVRSAATKKQSITPTKRGSERSSGKAAGRSPLARSRSVTANPKAKKKKDSPKKKKKKATPKKKVSFAETVSFPVSAKKKRVTFAVATDSDSESESPPPPLKVTTTSSIESNGLRALIYESREGSTEAKASERRAAAPRRSSHQEYMDAMDFKLQSLKRRQTLRSLDDMKEAPATDSRFFVQHTDLETVRVIGRFRPQNDYESAMEAEKPEFVSEQMAEPLYVSQNAVELFRCSEMDGDKEAFKCALDFIMPPKLQQYHVLNLIGRPFVENVLRGFNGTIFAYGQTGSGKSYSMFGPPKRKSDAEYGLVPRSVALLFKTLDQRMDSKSDASRELKKIGTADGHLLEYDVTMQCVQLYKDGLSDLMKAGGKSSKSGGRKLKIRTDFDSGSVYVQHLSKMTIDGVSEFLVELKKCFKHRIVASHKLNAQSSRSHMIVMLSVRQKFSGGTMIEANLNFGDLAGNEDVTKSLGATPDPLRLKEAIAINQSLSCLTTVINALVKGERPVYRQSPLTHMLKDSLGGNAKTTILVNLSPHWSNRAETIRTLRFALTAKKVQNNARVNRALANSELKKRIHFLEVENERLRAELTKSHAKVEILESQKRVQGSAKLKRSTGAVTEHRRLVSATLHLAHSVGEEEGLDRGYDTADLDLDDEEDLLESDEDFEQPTPSKEAAEHLSESRSAGLLLHLGQSHSSPVTGGSSSPLPLVMPMPLDTAIGSGLGHDRVVSVVDQLLSGEDLELRFQDDIKEYLDTIDALRSEMQAQEELVKDKDAKLKVLWLELEEQQDVICAVEDQLQEATSARVVEAEEKSAEVVACTCAEKFEAERQQMLATIRELEAKMAAQQKESEASEKSLERENDKLEKKTGMLRDQMHELKKESTTDKVAIQSLKEENALLRKRLERAEHSSVAALTSPTAAAMLDVSRTSLLLSEFAMADDGSAKSGSEEDEDDRHGVGSEESELEPIELLLRRFAGKELNDFGIAQKRRIGTVAKMVFDLNDEIGTLMDKWLPKGVSKQRLKSDKLIYQTRQLIAQFQLCSQQLAEYDASHLNAILQQNRANRREMSKLKRESAKWKKEVSGLKKELCAKEEAAGRQQQRIEELLAAEAMVEALEVADSEMLSSTQQQALFLTRESSHFGSIDFRSKSIDIKQLLMATPTVVTDGEIAPLSFDCDSIA